MQEELKSERFSQRARSFFLFIRVHLCPSVAKNIFMRALVTAGNTREAIDQVRDWGNRFTGNTGYSIAWALKSAGVDVTLLTSTASHREAAVGAGIRAIGFGSHADLKQELDEVMREPFDAVFMTAAVADYSPAGAYQVRHREIDSASGKETWTVVPVNAPKVKSSYDQIAFLGNRTEKLVDLIRTRWNHRGLLVKFKLEVGIDREELIRIGQASRESSGADYLVANTLAMVSGEGAGAYLVSANGAEFVPRDSLADRLTRLVVES
jgi:phosphopantothenoylcysteine synthetase/decarboxylase